MSKTYRTLITSLAAIICICTASISANAQEDEMKSKAMDGKKDMKVMDGKHMMDKDKEMMSKEMKDKEMMSKDMKGKEMMAKDMKGKEMMAKKAMMKPRLGLEGYCPVCIIDVRKWVKGTADHQATYDGVTYYFPGEGPKDKFVKSPEKYVPALNGDCIACYAKAKKRIPGNIRYASTHRGRLYLFPSNKEKQVFMDNPRKFENTDLALEGHCSVCKVMAHKEVPGNARFTAIHNGFRYLFPSNKERQTFLKTPAKFADQMLAKDGMAKDAMPRTAVRTSFTGKTSCAACEHGVHPIGSPDELGLAVTSNDGTIFVVEDAHSRWPSLYKSRFDGKSVSVKGNVIKRDGNIAWVKAEDLMVL